MGVGGTTGEIQIERKNFSSLTIRLETLVLFFVCVDRTACGGRKYCAVYGPRFDLLHFEDCWHHHGLIYIKEMLETEQEWTPVEPRGVKMRGVSQLLEILHLAVANMFLVAF